MSYLKQSDCLPGTVEKPGLVQERAVISVSMSIDCLLRALRSGQVHIDELNCLDRDSQRLLKGLLLQSVQLS